MNNKFALLTDIDSTLLPTMQTELEYRKRDLLMKLYDHMEGALALVTGRPQLSVDQTFPDKFPASVEHHSAWRTQKDAPYIDLEKPINSARLIAYARENIADEILIFSDKRQVLEDKLGVFLEEKRFSIAMVFSYATPTALQEMLFEVGNKALAHFDLAPTHRVIMGTDAVEISPRRSDKAKAVRDFMALPNFKGKIPVFIGDSSSDAHAMKVCAAEYGGYGIAVGSAIPDENYIQYRMNEINDVWAYLEKMLSS